MNTPIYFYYPNNFSEIIDYKSGLDCWILKTYLILKENKTKWNIAIGDSIPEVGIILFHKGFFPKNIIPSKNQLFVCIQADYGRYKYAQCHVLQNPAGLNNFKFSKKSYFEQKLFPFVKNNFVSHWNQDNIISRDKSRGLLFENVCFYGVPQNFPKEIMNQDFKDQLSNEGIVLNIITDSAKWNDYSQADCVLAIRDFGNKAHFNKPFSKIINGYLAGVPVIVGNESSALYLKNKVKLDIPIVKTKEECLKVIKEIKKEYQKKLDEVQQDNEKLKFFKDTSILLEWERLIQDLQQKFIVWQKSNIVTKKLFYQFCRI